ncbi:MAG: PEGA domain-containing protein, partial [bacterium]
SATLMGKLAYMSPEQVEGKPLDHRSDLFSLGTTAYHLLAGRHPFQRQSEAATLRAIEQVSFRPLRESAPDVPLPIARMVESLLALLPGDRPETARLVAEAFQEHLDPAAPRTLGRRITADTAGRSPRETEEPTAATLRRTKLPGALMPGVALAVAAAFLILFMGTRGPEPPPMSARPAAVAEAPAAPAGSSPMVPVTTLTVRTHPPGAEITADGVRLGKAPVEVTPGQGTVSPDLEARLYGYEPRSFSIPEGTRGSYTVSLSPLPTGTLRISAVPWATVRFRGEAAGETPLVLRDIPVGTHPLILVNDAMGVRREVMAEVVEGINTINVDLAAGK